MDSDFSLLASCPMRRAIHFPVAGRFWHQGKGIREMTDFEKKVLRNQEKFTEEMLSFMKQHDQRLQRIEQYNLQLVTVFNQASECLQDV